MTYASDLRHKVLLLLLAIALGCCQRHTPRLDDEPDEPETKEISIAINLPNSVALRGGDIDPMTSLESLRLVFYDNSTSPSVQEVRTIAITDPESLQRITTPLPPRDYRLVAIASPSPAIVRITQKGAPLSLLSTGQRWSTADFMTKAGSQEDKCQFVAMINEQGAVEVPATSFTEAQDPIAVSIEPTLARVYVFGDPELRGGGTKGSASPSYTIVGTQVETFPMRQMAKRSNGVMEAYGDRSPRASRYAKTPLWSQWTSQIPEDSSPWIQHRKETADFFKHAEIWCPIKPDKARASQDLTEAYLYIKEATLPEYAFAQGTTPCLVVRYPYIPQGITGLGAQEGFVKYRGQLYKESQVKEMIAGRAAMPQGLKQAIEQHKITAESFDQPFDKGELQFYKEAYSYYTIYIRHFEDAGASYGRYGLVRGNEYSIKIATILDLGLPTPPRLTNNHLPIAEHRAARAGVIIAELVERNTQETEL